MIMPLTDLKGIGTKRAEDFQQLGIFSVEDLLLYLPRAYRDYSAHTPVAEAEDGAYVAVRVRFLSEPSMFRSRGMSIVSAKASDGVSDIKATWFNMPYIFSKIHAGETKILCGQVTRKRGTAIINPVLADTFPGFVPEYPLCKGIKQRTVRDAVRAALSAEEAYPEETFPSEFREAYGLCGIRDAIRQVHCPQSRQELEEGRRRISFENILSYMLAMEMQRQERERKNGFSFRTEGIPEKYQSKLPYPLTGAQKRVIEEISGDMRSPVPMNRLLQGDVGSGKTAVAVYALCVAAANGKQGALLAPTAILAEQHYLTLREIFGDAAVLLTGSMKKSERDTVLDRLKAGTAFVVTGTHAILEEDILFRDLGVVITDEQHRFGVRQRAAIEKKGIRPDVLVMSATPIPRTLAMLLYGDLDVSLIDEMPPGRIPVKTSFIDTGSRTKMYDYIASEAEKGKQTYIVCPFIDPPEEDQGPSVTEVFKEFRRNYPDVPAGFLHGRMPQREKDEVMDRFRSGEIRVLVTTTVIEVGVHVEQALIMVIEGADRFGLAQMHQLRGRVGRGSEQAYCFLLSENRSDSVHRRFATFVKNTDGFKIAEEDLLQRGPGDFLGTRQHGEGEAELLRAASSVEMIRDAGKAAKEIISVPSVQNNLLLEHALRRFSRRMDDITMN